MSSIQYLSTYQLKTVQSQRPYTIIGHSAGSGTTYALLMAAHVWCEDNPNKFVTMFTTASPSISGGLGSQAKELLIPFGYKYSERSVTLTNPNGAKIKLIGCSGLDIENTLGLDNSFIIFDVGCSREVILKHFPRAKKTILATFIVDALVEGSWADQLGLLRGDKKGFIPIVYYIPASGVEDNYHLMQDCPDYANHISYLPAKDKHRITLTTIE